MKIEVGREGGQVGGTEVGQEEGREEEGDRILSCSSPPPPPLPPSLLPPPPPTSEATGPLAAPSVQCPHRVDQLQLPLPHCHQPRLHGAVVAQSVGGAWAGDLATNLHIPQEGSHY